jgi:4-hydroxy-2-oxoheptanedioate aldolase
MSGRLPKTSSLASRIRSGESLVGCQISGDATWLVEMASLAGFDYVTLDLEHEPVSDETAAGLIRAADAAGVPVIVRTHCDRGTQRLLNAGADGIQVPDVVTLADAHNVVQTTRFHPLGQRGYQTSTRSAAYGIGLSEKDYFRQANENLVVIAMIEDVATLDCLDELLAVEGIDAFYVGPGDLAQSMGFPDQDAVTAVVDEIIDRAVTAGRAIGLGVYTGFDPGKLAMQRAKGVRMFSVVVNRIIAHHLVQVRSSISGAVETS